jgi:hypothetical protein
LVQDGRSKMRRIAEKGLVKISGLVNTKKPEGISFSLDKSGGFARINIEGCNISVESSVPVSDYQALIGDTETLVSIRNEPDSPRLKVKHDDDSFTELDGDEEALFGIPADQQIYVEFSDVANAVFRFCKRLSYFVFPIKGCPDVNGQEHCGGYVHYSTSSHFFEGEEHPREETPVAPPAPEAPSAQGFSLPAPPPTIPPGSPIQP